MKKTLFTFLLFLVAVPLFASQPTTTRTAQKGFSGNRYKTVKHTFTATTSLDTILVLDKDSRAIDAGDLEVNRTILTLQFQTAEATAANSDWDVLWQVSSVSDASSTTFASGDDWTTVETDQNDNSISWIATFDAASYKGMRIRALLAEADATADAAVAIEAYFKYPRK